MKKQEHNSWEVEKSELKNRRRRVRNGKDPRDVDRQ
jgi:hypothetical protein